MQERQDEHFMLPDILHNNYRTYSLKKRLKEKASIVHYPLPQSNLKHLFVQREAQKQPETYFVKFKKDKHDDYHISKKAQTQPIRFVEEQANHGTKKNELFKEDQITESSKALKNIINLNELRTNKMQERVGRMAEEVKQVSSMFPLILDQSSIKQKLDSRQQIITSSLIKQKKSVKNSATKTVTEQSEARSNSRRKCSPKVIDIFKMYELKHKGKNSARNNNILQSEEDEQIQNKKRFLSKYESNRRPDNDTSILHPYVLEPIEQIKISYFQSPQVVKKQKKFFSEQPKPEVKLNKLVKEYKINDFEDLRGQKQKTSGSNMRTLDKHLAEINQKLKVLELRGRYKDHQIPIEPQGRVLTIMIYQNWGDLEFVGFNGIQIFDANGILQVPSKITANQGSVPKSKVANLLNGKYYTKNDADAWLSRVDQNNILSINITFETIVKISMIRIWNYNKSLRLSRRGIKTVQFKLDNAYIFAGNIRKAQGKLRGYQSLCEYIMFTNRQDVIKQIQAQDWLNSLKNNFVFEDDEYEKQTIDDDAEQDDKADIFNCRQEVEIEIVQNYGDPTNFAFYKIKMYDYIGNQISYKMTPQYQKTYNLDQRVFKLELQQKRLIEKIVIKNHDNNKAIKLMSVKLDTGLCYQFSLLKRKQMQIHYLDSSARYGAANQKKLSTKPKLYLQNSVKYEILCGKDFKLRLVRNWGNKKIIGLNKIQLYDIYGLPLLKSGIIKYTVKKYKQLANSMVNNSELGEYEYAPTDFAMELQSFVQQIEIKFEQLVNISALCLWNYKAEPNAGLKQLELRLDGNVVYQGYIRCFKNTSQFQALVLTDNQIIKNKLSFYERTSETEEFRHKIEYTNENKPAKEVRQSKGIFK